MATDDRLTAALEDMRKRYEVWGEADAFPRLLAALGKLLELADGWESNAPDVPLIDREAAACAVRETILAAVQGEEASDG
jgi:hypothetical protein